MPTQDHSSYDKKSFGLVISGCLCAAVAWLFLPALLGHDRLAYRDVSYFYYPLYEYVHARMAQGEFPSWNPLDQTGIPLLGEATTAVFYPGKCIFFLGLPTDVALTYYAVLHLLWAAVGTYLLSKREGHSNPAAWLAAGCYSLCGPLVFLYNNPPFLVGAAWLPWCFLTLRSGVAAEWRSQQQRRKLAVAAIVLAMPIFAGDPQTSLHALMLVAISQGWVAMRPWWYRLWARNTVSESATFKPSTAFRRSLVFLVSSGGLAAAIAAVQIVPALQWSQHSERRYQSPSGVARWLGGEVAELDRARSFLQAADPDSHANQLYGFSIPPSQLLGLGIPNVWGQAFPEHALTSALFWDADRLWTPNLYVGVIPLLFAFTPWIRRRIGFWEWLSLIGIACSMGKFLGWGAWELLMNPELRHHAELVSPVASPYWFLVTFVPGYASFRYPAKWLSVAVLGMAMSAAKSLSSPTPSRRAEKWLFISGALIAGLLFLSTLLPSTLEWIQSQLKQRPYDDALFGYFRTDLALSSMQWATLQTLLMCCIGFALLRSGWFRGFEATQNADPRFAAAVQTNKRQTHWHCVVVILLTFTDLALGASGLIALAPRSLDHLLMASMSRSETHEAWTSRRRWNVDLQTSPSSDWHTSSSHERIAEVAGSHLNVGNGRWHLYQRENCLNSDVSVNNYRVATLQKAITNYVRNLDASQRSDALLRIYGWLSLDAVTVPGKRESIVVSDRDVTVQIATRTVIPTSGSQPKVRLFEEPLKVKPLKVVDPEQHWAPLVHQAVIQDAMVPDFIETENHSIDSESFASRFTEAVDARKNRPLTSLGETSMTVSLPERFTIRVHAERDTWLYLAQYQDGNWTARRHSLTSDNPMINTPIYRANWIGQAIEVPQGEWEIEFRYQPRWFWTSILLSLIAVLITLGLPVRSSRCREASER